MNKERIMGVDVCVTDYDQLLSFIKSDIEDNCKSFIVAINPEKIIKANKDAKLKELLNSANYQIADGIGVVIASKINRGEIKERITGIDSMTMILKLANEENYNIFLFGGRPEVLQDAAKIIKEQYNDLSIVGTHDGYTDRSNLVAKINESEAQILFVALGSPTQEEWIIENQSELEVNIMQGIGGSLDVISNRLKRAPVFMQKMGMEWFYRLIKEPKRIFRQMNLFVFLGKVVRMRGNDEEV